MTINHHMKPTATTASETTGADGVAYGHATTTARASVHRRGPVRTWSGLRHVGRAGRVRRMIAGVA